MWWLVSSLFRVCRSFMLMWQESKERDPMPLPFYMRELILSWGPYPYTCCCSVTQLSATLCNPMDCSTPGLPVPHHLLEFAQVHVHCISDAIQPSHPLMTSSLSALDLSQHWGLFQWVICSHQMTKILELQLHHQSSSEYSGLISFKIDWFDLLAVQETFRSLLQHHSSKASVLWCSAFFMVQVSKPLGDVTPGKTIALTI